MGRLCRTVGRELFLRQAFDVDAFFDDALYSF